MSRPAPSHATLSDWIAQEAIPFSLDSSATLDAAVDTLIASLDPAVELLGFGEALHGGEEIMLLRNRIFQRLVAAHGYSAIAIESSFPRGHVANAYIAGHGPATYAEVEEAGFSHGLGRLDANKELIEWMRDYNADPAHGVKIRFYGFDSPTEVIGTDSPSHVLHFALDYLAAIDGSSPRRERIDALLGSDADWENPAASMDPSVAVGLSDAAAALRIETEDLMTELLIRRPELVDRSSSEQYLEALQHVSVARQLLNYHAGLARMSEDRINVLLGIRDIMMTDNLLYMIARECGRGKVLVFAHNGHLQRVKIEWQLGPHQLSSWPAGAHLREILGSRYVMIGTGLGVSEANGIAEPEPGTLEAMLTSLPESGVFIPIRRGQGLPAAEIAALPLRSGSLKNPSYSFLSPASFSDFDWLAFLDSATYTRGGPPLP